MTFSMLFLLLGGLGMFMFGMKMMSDGLEQTAGDKMRHTLEILTTNRLAGVGVGAAVTALIQSSSATTVMVVGFVNAGLMTLLQATGVIMGANIGTTITGQLIAFNLSEIAPLILFVGMVMTVFVQKRVLSRIGLIILGFGLLFVGLSLMSQAMIPLRTNEGFQNLIVSFKNPLVGVLAGALFTAIIQSSSASVGILQALALMGLIGLDSAVYVILGQNIGTCVTAILAAIGTSSNSKRAAGIHLMFNIMGTVIYLILLALFPWIVDWVQSISGANVARQIANFHTFFNVTVTVLLFPFSSYMVKLITRILPERYDPNVAEKRLLYLDARIAQTPAIALTQTLRELNRMGAIVSENLRQSIEVFFDFSESKVKQIMETEKTIDFLTDEVVNYLIEFRALDLTEHDLRVMGSLHHVIIHLERIGDRAENIAEYAIRIHDNKIQMTPEGQEELKAMCVKTQEAVDAGLEAFKLRDIRKIPGVDELEREVDDMEKTYITNHINRLQCKFCDPQAGVVFTNMISDLERIADHARGIANSLVLKD